MDKKDECAILCERVKGLRVANELSKKEMAKIMGVGLGSLNKVEAGDLPRRLGAAVLIRLSEYFNISIESLF